ncbi:hypothetical protein [Paraburkholderia domus]|uniref:hypothetical protein n=1 Tax=Paraburkholderia domus TaxID=2793075 RepID=UPI0019142603|nr:hypothetical protein [Paraburkholderia domus]MBK5183845.1 hypothetical protein [Burkholderia sp. R-69749]CAE6768287.1 hypothetical protein R69749_01107 [Paraburkholderia domus]
MKRLLTLLLLLAMVQYVRAAPPPCSPQAARQCNLAWSSGCLAPNDNEVCSNVDLKIPLGAIQKVPDQNAPQPAAPDVSGILEKLGEDPLNETAQAQARAKIAGCKEAKNVESMYTCSGFFVPPQVRLNCLNAGPCQPLAWKEVPRGNRNWWTWQVYSDVGDVRVAAYSLPWITTPSVAHSCALRNTRGGKLQEAAFALCMAQQMGGQQAQIALRCYKSWANSPSGYSACLSGVNLSQAQKVEIDCVVNMSTIDSNCARVFKIPAAQISKCASLGKQDQINCLLANPKSLSITGDCALRAAGDSSLLAACLKGVPMLNSSPTLQNITTCVAKVSGNKEASAQDQQKALLGCADATKQATGLIDDFKKTQALTDCLSSSQSDADRLACFQKSTIALPDQVKMVSCISAAANAIDLAACAGIRDAQKVKLASQCIEQANGDYSTEALCVSVLAKLPERQARLVSCAATSDGYATAAACMAAPYMSQDMARAVKCATESGGSPAGTAVCLAAPSMNAELRIAAECAVSSGGVPITFVVCAGGRLVMKELQQCIAGGFKSSNGCFGDNNEIVKSFTSQEKLLRGVLRTVGLENSYDNVLHDLKTGTLGKNNDARKVFEVVNIISIQKPAAAAAALATTAFASGRTVAKGVKDLADQVGGVQNQIQALAVAALPPVPGNIGGLRTDIPGGGSVAVGPTHVSASLGNNSVDVGPTSGQVKIAGVKIRVSL